ncbi:WD40-repeat-containing domain protein [Elaphomyces granulatus]
MTFTDFGASHAARRRPSFGLKARPGTAFPGGVSTQNTAWAQTAAWQPLGAGGLDDNTVLYEDSSERLYRYVNVGEDEYSGHVLEETHIFPSPVTRHRSTKSFSSFRQGVDGLRALGRRLSVTIRRKSSKHCLHVCQGESYQDDSTTTRHHGGRGNWEGRSKNSYSINRRPSLHSVSALQNFYASTCRAAPPIPGNGSEPPVFPDDLTRGAAARAAAAAQNEMAKAERAGPRVDSKLLDLVITRDSESGIDIDIRDRSEISDSEFAILRIDPVKCFPTEIVAKILSYLDPESLLRTGTVSRSWHREASSHHVWRTVFRREYGAHFQGGMSTKRKTQSTGLGKTLPNQDWKRMFFVRRALEHRWKTGRAAAIYLHGHRDSVYCVQFDENKIITGSRDRTIRVWDAHYPWPCLKIIGAPTGDTPDATTNIATNHPAQSSGRSPFLTICPPSKPTASIVPEQTSDYHKASILCLQFDEEIMVTGSSDFTCIVWDIKNDYRPIRRLVGHQAGVLDICFDDKYIVSCSKDTTICVWDRYSGELLKKLFGHRGPVNAVQLRGDLLVSASGDGVAKLWNISSGLCVKEFPSKDRGLACVEFSEDARTILAGGNDQVIYQFDTNTGELVKELNGHSSLVRSLHLDDLNNRVISGSYDMSVKVFNAKTGELSINLPGWTTSWMLSAKSDYRRIIATSQDSRAVIMDFGFGLDGIELLEE